MLATVMSGIITFWGAPKLYGMTAFDVKRFAIDNYGAWTEGLIGFMWFVACALIVFAICRIVLISALWAAHLFMASRGFGRH
ncbi:MAG TPA: hypothetical protein VJM34_14340 [Novosphingobium sp.]|nr:hypothetical protein [Novosphingobium sp.]